MISFGATAMRFLSGMTLGFHFALHTQIFAEISHRVFAFVLLLGSGPDLLVISLIFIFSIEQQILQLIIQ
jgi:ABC-type dipeptide/oligopeptide/nickel transport system permease subunit